MKRVAIIVCCVVIIFVLPSPNIQVEGLKKPRPCAEIKVQLAPCLLHLKHCHTDCNKPPCDDGCGSPPLTCCLHLGRIVKKINSDEDAKRMCSCLRLGLIEEVDLLVTGSDICRLPKECNINIMLPEINSQTNCSKYVIVENLFFDYECDIVSHEHILVKVDN